jgi:hypothetical protein
VGTIHSGPPSLWAMIEDFTDEFYMTSSGDGARHGGTTCPHHNHNMARGHPGRSDHDDSSTADAHTAARFEDPFER